MPGGRGEVVVIASELTTIVSCCEEEAPVASVTVTVKVELPPAVALPVICTVFVVLLPRLSPAGSAPAVIDHERGGTPPVAVTEAL